MDFSGNQTVQGPKDSFKSFRSFCSLNQPNEQIFFPESFG